ncbi:MAG: hypothetical protein Q9161_002638 [Pseudevernia consocians]
MDRMDRMDNRNVLRSLLTTADPDAISLPDPKPRTLFVHARVQRPELAQRDVARREGAFAGVGGDDVDGVPVGAGGVCGEEGGVGSGWVGGCCVWEGVGVKSCGGDGGDDGGEGEGEEEGGGFHFGGGGGGLEEMDCKRSEIPSPDMEVTNDGLIDEMKSDHMG